MASLFDGPKSVLGDIGNIMRQSQEKKVSSFVDEARSKGYQTPQQIGDYARVAKKDAAFAAQVEAAARKK
jgi:hypothetical protein